MQVIVRKDVKRRVKIIVMLRILQEDAWPVVHDNQKHMEILQLINVLQLVLFLLIYTLIQTLKNASQDVRLNSMLTISLVVV